MEPSQNNPRKHRTPDQKFKIIKEQMTTKTSVTEICKKYDIVPSQFYKWQDKFLKGALENIPVSQGLWNQLASKNNILCHFFLKNSDLWVHPKIKDTTW